MKIIRTILITAFNGLLLFILLFAVGRTDDLYFNAGHEFPFSAGNASGDVRSAIMLKLQDFQDGYTRREPSQVEPFTTRLFSADNIIILGTMPDEIYVGHEEATQLVESDWKYWGDCRFLMENAQISVSSDVAWFSTIGTVHMDGINIILPLRLSGVLAKEDNDWMFQQLQFQFDLNLRFLFLVIGLLLVWFVVNIFLVLFYTFRAVKRRVTVSNRHSD